MYNPSIKGNHLFIIIGYHKSYQDYSINDDVSEFLQLYLIFECLKYDRKDSNLVNLTKFCSQIFVINLINIDPLKMKLLREWLIHSPL